MARLWKNYILLVKIKYLQTKHFTSQNQIITNKTFFYESTFKKSESETNNMVFEISEDKCRFLVISQMCQGRSVKQMYLMV